ncbi:hypothetical protein BpHYR1_036140 [Brachionus plicatilis]|uniref:Uncharacterized protein n=1 Tax=Brachionus plicatilis TaxID=10195 RepID=A0A3M7S5Z2_BRAPC|nr:hypothetical protein BpHYR1_036140 [Brachionus plicatilis]
MFLNLKFGFSKIEITSLKSNFGFNVHDLNVRQAVTELSIGGGQGMKIYVSFHKYLNFIYFFVFYIFTERPIENFNPPKNNNFFKTYNLFFDNVLMFTARRFLYESES